MSEAVQTFLSADLTPEALRKRGIVLVDCWAAWCAPCRMLAATIEEIAVERPDITVGKLNIDDDPVFAEENGISAIPTLLLYKDGVEADRLIGLYSKNTILDCINRVK